MSEVQEEFIAPTYAVGGYTDEPLWSEIVPGLWQGGTADEDTKASHRAPMITTREFQTVVTLYAWANPVDWFVREYRLGVMDSRVDAIDPDALHHVVDFAHGRWVAGDRVLIRSQAGWNRSGLITALVLIRAGHDPADAINLIRARRSPNALCNTSFERWLLAVDPEHWRHP